MRYGTYGFVLAAVLLPCAALAAPASELHITPDGTLSAKNLVVVQKAGSNLFCRATWGNAFVRLTVITTPNNKPAEVRKSHGGVASIDDIHDGDVLNIEGTLSAGAEMMLINASRITDLSLEREQKTLAGSVVSTNSVQSSFVLKNTSLGTTTVAVGTSTITKGVRTIVPSDIAVGDKILSASGVYDYQTNTLVASSITIFQDKTVFLPRIFEGKIQSIGGTALPTSVVLTVGGSDYTVYLAAGANILNTNRTATSLARFAVGDSVRAAGSIRPTNLREVDATTIRDLNF